MFHGSIPASVISMLSEATTDWSGTLLVGCSGNFTVERALSTSDRFRFISNDVTLYSLALSGMLTGVPTRMTIRPEYAEEWGWLSPYLNAPLDQAASIMLLTRAVLGLGRTNSYYRRLRAAYRDQWPTMFSSTVERIAKVQLPIDRYISGDVLGAMEEYPELPFCCFPPFTSTAYASDMKFLHRLFDWDEPSYQPLDEEHMGELVAQMLGRERWFYANNVRRPELEDHLVGFSRTTNRGLPIYVYASKSPTRIETPRQQTSPLAYPRLGPDEEIGSKMSLIKLERSQFHTLRSLYMNRGIPPGNERMAMGVLVDGKLIGVWAVVANSATAVYSGKFYPPAAYLLSDFPVSPVKYKRLAKLVLMAMLSTEAQVWIERALNGRIRSITTTAFSQRPVSMKYRGLFTLISRKERNIDQGSVATSYLASPYELQYASRIGRWTLAEALSEWKMRHSTTGRAEE